MIESSLRIRIVGGPGSGKTHLANLISEHTNSKYLNLDELFWSKGKKRNPEDRDALLAKVLTDEEWIIEGSYDHEWVYATFIDSTMIIVLNPSVFVRVLRVIGSFFSSLFSSNRMSLCAFVFNLRSTFAYNKLHLEPLLHNNHIKKRSVVFSTADKAYEYFIEETAPDLFM